MADTINLNVEASAGTDVGGVVYDDGGFSTDPTSSINGSSGVSFVAFNLADLPGLALTAEYRYMTIPGAIDFHGQYFAPKFEHGITLRTEPDADVSGGDQRHHPCHR